jgi:hypothetical protein
MHELFIFPSLYIYIIINQSVSKKQKYTTLLKRSYYQN